MTTAARFKIVGGQCFRYQGLLVKLKKTLPFETEETWEVENLVKGNSFPIKRRDLDAEIEKNALEPVDEDGSPSQTYAGAKLVSHLPDPEADRVRFEKDMVRNVEERWFRGITTAKDKKTGEPFFERLLRDLGTELGKQHLGEPCPMGVTAYYALRNRCRTARTPDEAASHGNRGRWERFAPGSREAMAQAMREIVHEYKTKRDGKGRIFLTTKKIFEKATEAFLKVKKEALRDAAVASGDLAAAAQGPDGPEEDPCKSEGGEGGEAENAPPAAGKKEVPDRSTYYRILHEEVDEYDLTLVMKGRSFANAAHRGPSRVPNRTTYALQWVQFDETLAPIHFYLEALGGLPLGKATVAWFVDVHCAGVVGFWVGFSPPSAAVLAAALKHCCLPKTYMRQLYPSIDPIIIMAGLPHLFTFDNSKQARGNDARRMAFDLDINFEFAPPRHPWLKSLVERFFKKLNEELLRLHPGYVFPTSWNIPKADYDPRVQGAMDFHAFLALFHAWVAIEVNGKARNGRPSPNDVWLESVKAVEPEFIANSANLDALFGKRVKARRLDDRGIHYKGLSYYSNQLHDYRFGRGAKLWVETMVNDLNVRMVHVLANDGSWMPAYTTAHPEIDPLPAFLVKILRAQSKRQYQRDDMQGQALALEELRRIMAFGYDDRAALRDCSRIARAFGIDLSALLQHQGHDGALQLPTVPEFMMTQKSLFVPEKPKLVGFDDPAPPSSSAPVQEQLKETFIIPRYKKDNTL